MKFSQLEALEGNVQMPGMSFTPTIEMHLPKPIAELLFISKSILMITLICNAFSFCVLPLAGSAKEIVEAERAIVRNNHSKNLPVQPINFSDQQPRNAAASYLKAFDLLKYPESKTLGGGIGDVPKFISFCWKKVKPANLFSLCDSYKKEMSVPFIYLNK